MFVGYMIRHTFSPRWRFWQNHAANMVQECPHDLPCERNKMWWNHRHPQHKSGGLQWSTKKTTHPSASYRFILSPFGAWCAGNWGLHSDIEISSNFHPFHQRSVNPSSRHALSIAGNAWEGTGMMSAAVAVSKVLLIQLLEDIFVGAIRCN